jgi:aldose 1-epimerase
MEDTPFDFRQGKKIGADIEAVEGRYDHNFVLNKGVQELTFAARAHSPITGITLEICNTEPGLKFYSGNFLDGTIVGKNGIVYKKHFGFCLETQHFPNSPNEPRFPSVASQPGEIYKHLTVHRFAAE